MYPINLVRFLTIALLLIASLTGFGFQVPGADVPDWIEYSGEETVPGITLRWRVHPKYTRGGEHFFQFDFINATDKARAFDYYLTTDAGEIKVGRIHLKPRANLLSGWYFEGRTITRFGSPPGEMIDAILTPDRFR